MKCIHTAHDLRHALSEVHNIAFVPTMGNLHAGHVALAQHARQRIQHNAETTGQNGAVVVSIFVNPLQFGPNEDYARYPRTLAADCEQLAEVADIVFAPSVEELYPDFNPTSGELGQTMCITAPPIADTLCGAHRPGHFSGVATVVMKLFHLVQPTVALFGKKDYQQLTVIRELVRQFQMPIEIIGIDTVREPDGLAMSSRNGYLSPMERQEAIRLYKVLLLAMDSVKQGQMSHTAIEQQCQQYLTQLGWMVDYIAIRSAQTLLPLRAEERDVIVLGAAKLGKTRLIDNIIFRL